MPYEIRPLNESHLVALLALWNLDIEQVCPFMAIRIPDPAEVFASTDPDIEGVTVQGAFHQGRLVAAMKWGQRKVDAPTGDLGNLFPGDGVISWLFFEDESGAEALFAQAQPSLGKRIYAFPEYGDMVRYTIFSTGMLSLGRRRVVSFFENHGFTVPAAEAWGPQERICFRLSIPARIDIPALPPEFRLQIKQEGLVTDFQLYGQDGARAGASSMGPARMAGQVVPKAAFLNWIGVEAFYRGRGLANTLLLKQMELARQQGAGYLYLTTHSGRPAWKLYQKMGFQEVGRLRSYVLKPG